MNNRLAFYCDECFAEGNFKIIEINEKVTVRDLTFENTHTYYKCNHCQELYEPFDNPDLNYLSDYEKYCELKGILSYKEIREIRENYQLSQRDFAKLLAVSHATVSRIENGEIPSEQQDVLFKLASDPYSFYHNIVKTRGSRLSEKALRDLEERLQLLMACSYKEHENELQTLYEKMNEQTNDIKILMNKIFYTQSLEVKNKETLKEDGNKWKPTSILSKVGLL